MCIRHRTISTINFLLLSFIHPVLLYLACKSLRRQSKKSVKRRERRVPNATPSSTLWDMPLRPWL